MRGESGIRSWQEINEGGIDIPPFADLTVLHEKTFHRTMLLLIKFKQDKASILKRIRQSYPYHSTSTIF